MAYRFSIGSAEAARLDVLPKPAEREAGKYHRLKYKIGGENVELVVVTHNDKNLGVRYKRACAKCGNPSLEPMDTPGDVFCEACGGKKDKSSHRARKAHDKAKRDA